MKIKRLLIFFSSLSIVVTLLFGCTYDNSGLLTKGNGTYYSNDTEGIEKLAKQYNTEILEEYSFLQEKGSYTITRNNNEIKIFLSKGKPDVESSTKLCDKYVVKHNNNIYFTNNENIYCYDGNATKLLFKKNEQTGAPFYIDIYNEHIFYLTEWYPDIFVLNLNDSGQGQNPKKIGQVKMYSYYAIDRKTYKTIVAEAVTHRVFLVEEGHIFYIAKDGVLHRMTENGSEDTVLTGNVSNISYSNNYIYFTRDDCLYKIKCDGGNEESVTTFKIASYLPTNSGVIYCISNDSIIFTYFYLNENQRVTRKIFEGHDKVMYYDLFGSDDKYLYFYYDDFYQHNQGIVKVAISGGQVTEILSDNNLDTSSYPPILIDNYIYYCSDKLYRINTAGMDREEIGPPNIYKSSLD